MGMIEKMYDLEPSEKRVNVEIFSPSLLEIIKKHLDKKIEKGRWGYLGETELKGNILYTEKIDIFDLLWTICREFNQVFTNTCQFGDMAILNHEGKKDEDVGRQWCNAIISTRSEVSKMF